MSDESRSIWIFLFVIGFLVVAYINTAPFSNEITIYPQIKSCDNESNKCEWHTATRVTYRPIVETQTLLFWATDDGWPIIKRTDCKIASIGHWLCEGDYVFGFSNGSFYNLKKGDEKIRYVTKFSWWLGKL